MRSESCSFIWHPKVVTWYVFTRRRRLASAGGLPLVFRQGRELHRLAVPAERDVLRAHPDLLGHTGRRAVGRLVARPEPVEPHPLESLVAKCDRALRRQPAPPELGIEPPADLDAAHRQLD